MIWTPETIATAIALKNEGLSGGQIARKMGATRSQIISKLWRIQNPQRSRETTKTHADTAWDRLTFEPYAEFKARRQMERQNGLR